MKPVKWGIISTANIGVAKVIPGMLKSKDIDIVAISSRKKKTAEEWAGKLGIPKAYGSYEEMLADQAEADAEPHTHPSPPPGNHWQPPQRQRQQARGAGGRGGAQPAPGVERGLRLADTPQRQGGDGAHGRDWPDHDVVRFWQATRVNIDCARVQAT